MSNTSIFASARTVINQKGKFYSVNWPICTHITELPRHRENRNLDLHFSRHGKCRKFTKYQGVKEFHTLARIGCNCKTRMHTSRMCTARLLPVSPSMHCWGGVPAWGMPGLGGVPARGVPAQVLPRPWTEFLTHTSANITLPQTSFVGGNYGFQSSSTWKWHILSLIQGPKSAL